MKLEHVALAGLGLLMLTRLNGASGGAAVSLGSSPSAAASSTPTQSSAAPVDNYAMKFATPREGYQYYHSEITKLGKWYQAEKNKLAPLNESYNTLLNKIAYMRAYPGETTAKTLPIYQSQLETMEAQIQSLIAPVLNTYNERMSYLGQQQAYYRRLI